LSNFRILYDEPHEAAWFRSLHPDLRDVPEEAITAAEQWPTIQNVLLYDRPDIILLDGNKPILVVEETVEVPSGHNVGQRFARIAAAAECGVPCLYFGPYVAQKHGGETAGPRYMNLRLFQAIDAMVRITGTAVTTINWPVDEHCEVRRDREKDHAVRLYMSTFLAAYRSMGLPRVNAELLSSGVQMRMLAERRAFAQSSIRNPEQYDTPPGSVEFLSTTAFGKRHGPGVSLKTSSKTSQVVLYKVGMTNIRSDPYTGMAMLYRYLYILEHADRALFLHFPNITTQMWRSAAQTNGRKDIRLFRIAAEAIAFSDGVISRENL
jgi:hypothetical protein